MRMSYSVRDKLKLPLLQHNDRVTNIIPDINLLVRIQIFMQFVFYEYLSFTDLSTFVRIIHAFICVCVHLFCLLTVQFISVINFIITCMFYILYSLLWLNIAGGNLGNQQRSKIVKHHEEVGKQMKGIFVVRVVNSDR